MYGGRRLKISTAHNPKKNSNSALFYRTEEYYFAGDLTHRYLRKELGIGILMDSTEMQKLRIQMGQSRSK
jgi:hypothetical protein